MSDVDESTPDPVPGPETDAPVIEDADPLLERAARIADLPLDERPAAFDGLNRSLVAELHALEDA